MFVIVFMRLFPFIISDPEIAKRSFRKKLILGFSNIFGCANEPFARGYPAERGPGGALGETPNELGAV